MKSLNQPLSDKRGTRTSQAEARKAAKRDLSVIEAELHAALKSATKNKIKIGGLLIEAKETVPHGEWLAWLENNFALSERSAQHYMVAWKFAAKYENFADLKLHLTAIYALDKYDDGIVAHVLEVAKTKWLSGADVDRIAEEFLRFGGAEQEAEKRQAARGGDQRRDTITGQQHGYESQEANAPAEAASTLDASYPVVAPPAEPAPPALDDVLIATFQRAITMLKGLTTKSAAGFVSADCSTADLDAVTNFLNQVAAAKQRRTASPRGVKYETGDRGDGLTAATSGTERPHPFRDADSADRPQHSEIRL
jgi:hypothetical protein